MPFIRHRSTLIALPAALAAAALAGCTPSSTPAPSSTSTSTASTPGSSPGDLAGATVTVAGLWSGPELTSFQKVAASWQDQTGATLTWQASQDLSATLGAAIQAGDPPDLAVLPNPGLLHQLAHDGALVPLDRVLDAAQVRTDFAPAWLDLGSDGGTLYGLVAKASSKATVWYDPTAFSAAGYAAPATWDDLTALADRMVADGRTPFSIVGPSGPGSGWALTDVVSQIVLSACGTEVYDSWVAGRTSWTDPCIAASFARFDTLVQTPGYVLGGAQGILSTGDAAGSYPMYTDPPTAWMYPMASFAQGFITARYPDLTAGQDYGFFPFPSVDAGTAGAVTIGGDILVMLHDTPAARSLLAYLTGTAAQEQWIGLGGFTSVNRSVPADAYPDPVAAAVARQLTDATTVRYAAGDLLPAAVQRAWWAAMVTLVRDPGTLDASLASLTRLAQSAG